MKRLALATVVLLVVAGGLGYVATLGDGASTSGGGMALSGGPAPTKDVSDASLSGVYATDESARAQVAGGDMAGTPAEMPADVFAAPTGGYGPKVIKTAYLTLEVRKDGFENAWRSASMVAQRYDGFIVSSSSSGEGSRSGELLIRVPSAAFDQAMEDLRGLGDAEKESVSGQEVTDQFVDLNARLRSWEAQQRVLLRLMDKANSISETMTVQREIQQVQVQIEQIKGQLRMLRDQTSFGTIQLALHEPGAVITKPEPKPVQTPSLATAWARSWAGFLSVLGLVIVGLGYLIPLAAIALPVWLLVRRRGLRPQAVTTT